VTLNLSPFLAGDNVQVLAVVLEGLMEQANDLGSNEIVELVEVTDYLASQCIVAKIEEFRIGFLKWHSAMIFVSSWLERNPHNSTAPNHSIDGYKF